MNKTTEILLINPAGKHIVGDRTPPYGLLSLAAALPRETPLRVLDLRFEKHPAFDAAIASPQLRLVGISCLTGKQVGQTAELTRLVHARTKAPVVWGGIFPTQMTEMALRQGGADGVVRGEGEAVFRALAASPSLPATAEPAGFARLNSRGELIGEKSLGARLDLAEIPDPRFDLVDVRRYIEHGPYGPAFSLLTSRGCPCECAYCYMKSIYDRHWRGHAAEWVVEMVRRLHRDYGIRHFQFMDDNFMTSLERMREIARRLLEARLDLTWAVFGATVVSLNNLGLEGLRLLHRAGCRIVNIGTESGSEIILQMIHKNVDLPTLLKLNGWMKEAGLKPSYNFMSGFPGESDADVRQSVDLMLRLKDENPAADCGTIKLFLPYPGTELYEVVRRDYGFRPPAELSFWSRYSWSEADGLAMPWLAPRRKKRLLLLYYLSILMNPRYLFIRSRFFRAAAFLLYPLTRYRFRRMRVDTAVLPRLLHWIYKKL